MGASRLGDRSSAVCRSAPHVTLVTGNQQALQLHFHLGKTRGTNPGRHRRVRIVGRAKPLPAPAALEMERGPVPELEGVRCDRSCTKRRVLHAMEQSKNPAA
jgi:hypothetical protein